MKLDRQKLKTFIHNLIKSEHEHAGLAGTHELLDRGKEFELAETLNKGGAILFPHAGYADCGHQIAAAVHACLDSGADRVLAVGVLHALSDELEDARNRVSGGGNPSDESSWGIQGPGLDGQQDWKDEFSLLHFLHLWNVEVERRGISGPELILRYPYLVGGNPKKLPGITELEEIVKNAVVVTTADAFHHGIGYGEPEDSALHPEAGGLDLAQETISAGLKLLHSGDYWAFNQHCVWAKSDGRDAGQVVRHLLGPLDGKILDMTYTDTTKMYDMPPPTWVAAALIEFRKSE